MAYAWSEKVLRQAYPARRGVGEETYFMNVYRGLVQPVLFGLDPEFVHKTTLTLCGALGRSRQISDGIRRMYAFDAPKLRTQVAGVDFPNPIGLGAGFDKNGVAIPLLASLGFGYLEIGSVSASPSEGNRVRPRLFRLPVDEALMVYYGVPNDGVEVVARRLASLGDSMSTVPIGVSVVETNTGTMSTAERVVEQLATAVRGVSRLAGYLVINLSCPNTSGGMSHFADVGKLQMLLEQLRDITPLPPVFLKITPPKQSKAIDAVLQACDPFTFVKGFVLNTHADDPRSLLRTPAELLDRMRGSVTGPVNP